MNESKAIGYTRVSPRDQAANAISLVSQRRKIEAYAVLHELELVEVIEDAGYSAKSLDRPGMAELLRLIRGRKVGVVVIAKLDRITRSVRDLGDLVELFQRSGVEFASVADHIDTSTAWIIDRKLLRCRWASRTYSASGRPFRPSASAISLTRAAKGLESP